MPDLSRYLTLKCSLSTQPTAINFFTSNTLRNVKTKSWRKIDGWMMITILPRDFCSLKKDLGGITSRNCSNARISGSETAG